MPLSTTFSSDVVAPRKGAFWSSGSWARDLVLLAVLAGIWCCALLGDRPLSNPDEGRYTEIPREMAVSGDFVTPRLNGVKYFEKPPLVYWLSALTIRQFGVSEFTGRIWGALFAALGILLSYIAGRVIYGRVAGIWAAVVLATTLLYYVMSQIILLDMAVAVTMSGSLFAFILAMREPRGWRRFWLFMAFYGFMALATLSKGLIGIAIPGAILFLWTLLLNRWRPLWPFYPWVGTVLLLAVAGPWHYFAAKANHDFLSFYFIHEHWERFTTKIHGRYEPWWFFLPIFVGGLFPWVFFSGEAVRKSLVGGWKERKNHSEAWFLVIWVVFTIAFFSKSQSKLVPYILPVFPACAVLLGNAMAGIWRNPATQKLRAVFWAVVVVFVIIALIILVAPAYLKDGLMSQTLLKEILPFLQIGIVGSVLVGVAVIFVKGIRGGNHKVALMAVAMTTGAVLMILGYGGGYFEKTSTKRFAEILRPMLKPEDRVYSVGTYTQDLPVYLERLISVVEYDGELTFGIHAEPELTAARFLKKEAFARQWQEPGAAYAVVRRSFFERALPRLAISYTVLAETDKFVLIRKSLP